MDKLLYGVARLYARSGVSVGIQIYASCYPNKLFNYGCRSIFTTYELAVELVKYKTEWSPELYWFEDVKYLDHAYLDRKYDDDDDYYKVEPDEVIL